MMLTTDEKTHREKRITEAVSILNESEVGRLRVACIAQLINAHRLRDSKMADDPGIYILFHYGFGKDTCEDVLQAIGRALPVDIVKKLESEM